VFPWTTKQFTDLFTRERIIELDFVTGEAGTTAPKKRKAPGINPDQIPEFYRSTKHLMHRLIYRDPEVSGQVKFPPVNYHVERCNLLHNHADFYYDLHEQVTSELSKALAALKTNPLNSFRIKQNVLTQIQLLRRAASCPWASLNSKDVVWTDKYNVSKLHKTVDICLKAKAEGRKTIVFTNFIDTGRAITEVLTQAGIKAVRVYATDKQEKPVTLDQENREARIEKFLADPSVDVLVGNLSLLSTGITMVAASIVINYDHDWRANTYKQGISRVVRPGQVWSHVDVYDLLTDKTVDLYVFHALMNKVKATAEMIDRQFNLEALKTDETLMELDPVSIAQALLSGELVTS
jgi:SNF2 family DNA or RNA helicase